MRPFRELPNGDLWIADSKNPPPAPSGYYQNPGKLYYYHLVLKECSERIITKEKLCCSKSKEIIYCDKIEDEISQIQCRDCKR
jgi:hypothetical protein